MTRKCSWCGRTFVDDVTRDEYTRGTPEHEAEAAKHPSDIPDLCTSCSAKASGK